MALKDGANILEKLRQPILRQASLEDIDYIISVESDSENAAFVGQWTRIQHLRNIDDDNFSYLIIESRESFEHLGYVILEGVKDQNRSLNIKRIVVVEKGRGVGRAAIRLIKELAFREHKMHRLWLDVKTFNARAKHIYETEGFIIEGTLRDCIKRGNQYESLTVLSILENEFR